jgi:hypothetical protein
MLTYPYVAHRDYLVDFYDDGHPTIAGQITAGYQWCNVVHGDNDVEGCSWVTCLCYTLTDRYYLG